jgi:hypothetical protein
MGVHVRILGKDIRIGEETDVAAIDAEAALLR